MRGLRSYGEDVERTAQTGKDDESDQFVRDGKFYILIEAKNHARIDLADFMDQALRQRDNFCKARSLDPNDVMPVVAIKRRGKSWDQAYIVTIVKEYFGP